MFDAPDHTLELNVTVANGRHECRFYARLLLSGALTIRTTDLQRA